MNADDPTGGAAQPADPAGVASPEQDASSEWWQGLRRAAAVRGPVEAWLQPRVGLWWEVAEQPVDGPVAKLGGQPYWLEEPFWPVSAFFRTPMVFIGQFPLPGAEPRMAYLFIADDPDGVGLTMEPEEGDNLLLVQPGGRIPAFSRGLPQRTGPSLWRRGERWTDRVPVELRVRATEHVDEDCYSWAGGRPRGWQSDFVEMLDERWRFFFQLDGAEGVGGDAYALNFGGGTGYAFLSSDEREGRFFWDCV